MASLQLFLRAAFLDDAFLEAAFFAALFFLAAGFVAARFATTAFLVVVFFAAFLFALDAVGLLDELLQLPDGLNSTVQTSGAPLTHSQALRLMLARALRARLA